MPQLVVAGDWGAIVAMGNSGLAKPNKAIYLAAGLLVLVFSCLLANQFYQFKLNLLESENASLVALRTSAIRVDIESVDQHLAGFAAWVATQKSVNKEKFRTFGQLSKWARPGVVDVGWIPRIEHAQRPDYESGKISGMPIRIMDISAPGEQRPAEISAEYYPITVLMNDYSTESALIGFNLLSEPARRTAIERAVASRNTALTAKIRSNNDPSNPGRLAMFKPVFAACAPSDCNSQVSPPQGMVAALLDLEALVSPELKETMPIGHDLYIYDVSPDMGERELLYFHPSRTRHGDFNPQTLLEQTKSHPRWAQPLEVGGRQLQFTSVAARPILLSALLPAAGIGLLTAALGLVLVGWAWLAKRHAYETTHTLQKLSTADKYREFSASVADHMSSVSVFDLDAEIERALQELAQLMGVDGGYIFLFREDGETFDMAYEWRKNPELRVKPQLQGLTLDSLPWFAERIRRHEVSVVPDVAKLPRAAAAEKRIFEAQGRVSLVDVPIVQTGKLLGFLGLDDTSEIKFWHAEVIAALKLSGEMFAAALVRKYAYDDRLVAAEEISHLRSFDALTGLPNRQHLLEYISNNIGGGSREGSGNGSGDSPGDDSIGLLLIDLRHFGRICDSLGAQTGDNILCAVANRFEALINAPDIAARLGSDVFAIVLHGTGKDDQRVQAKIPRFLSVIKSPLTIGKHDIRLSCCSGIAFSEATDDAEELLAKAEQTLLGAKRRGTDEPGVYEPEAHASARRLHRLQGDLRTAISDQEFALYFQPQYRVLAENGHQLCGFEVLLRWLRPGGMVPPAEFIPAAEDSGLIMPLWAWVLEETGRIMRHWLENYPNYNFTVAINVSPLQFAELDLYTDISALIKKFSLPPELLELEITEGILIQDVEHTGETLKRIRELGVRFSVDDFGTGYSSLAYLQQLPLDHIKIDRSFISVLDEQCTDAPIVRATVSMAHDLGMRVVAEGVETQAQLDYLQDIGCDIVQGFFLGRPMPEHEAEQLIKSVLG